MHCLCSGFKVLEHAIMHEDFIFVVDVANGFYIIDCIDPIKRLAVVAVYIVLSQGSFDILVSCGCFDLFPFVCEMIFEFLKLCIITFKETHFVLGFWKKSDEG